MSTLLALVLVVIALGMLAAYHLGHAAGMREGFEKGREEGEREGSTRAFAVGYDRGLHDREVKQQEAAPSEPARPNGSLWVTILLVLLTIVILAAAFP